ncbi:MAG: Gfo/Idh/MocA family oxidoreductase [Acidimicrobiales bacterium]|nr:Gfo/Idh/MocA family oxidoreductase [Acidimicrobiales bacterium]
MARLEPVGIGVLGARSSVASRAVLPAIHDSDRCRLVAAGSRAGPTSYDDVLADPAVEAVYLALPNGLHRPWAERAAGAGKHVLCEKPLAPTAADAETMAAACRVAGVLLAEAYMTPFHPRAARLVQLARDGDLGRITAARGSFTFPIGTGDGYRWDPAQGGGALLDVGVYCLAPILEVIDRPPVAVAASADRTSAGVDRTFSAWLDFGGGATATVLCSFDLPERQLLELVGSEASLAPDRAFTPGPGEDRLWLRRRDGGITELVTGGADPYRGMVDAFAAAVRGEVAWPRPVERSIELLALLDRLRDAA